MKNDIRNELAVCGFEAVKALAKNNPQKITRFYYTRDRMMDFKDLFKSLAERKVPYNNIPEGELEKLSGTPHHQGVVAMIGVFVDTFIVLTLNALVIITTLYTKGGILAEGYTGAVTETISKTNLAQTAFGSVFGTGFGSAFVAICLFFFAFSTILGWNLFGKINMIYLFGEKSTKVYTIIALIFIFLGTLASNDLVWELTDMFNQLMVIPNAIALFALTAMVVKVCHGAGKNS